MPDVTATVDGDGLELDVSLTTYDTETPTMDVVRCIVPIAALAAITACSPGGPKPAREAESEAHDHHHDHAPAAGADGGGAPTASPTTSDAGTTSDAASTVAAPDPIEAEQAAYARAKTVFEQTCSGCHTPKGSAAAVKHLDVSSYPFGGHHADDIGAAVRTSLGAGGKKATMPKDAPGSVRGEELAAVLAWADAFDRAKAAGLHKPASSHGHGHKH